MLLLQFFEEHFDHFILTTLPINGHCIISKEFLRGKGREKHKKEKQGGKGEHEEEGIGRMGGELEHFIY